MKSMFKLKSVEESSMNDALQNENDISGGKLDKSIISREKDEVTGSNIIHRDMKQWGWEQARSLDGSLAGLKNCVALIYQNHIDNIRRNKELAEKTKLPYKIKLTERLTKAEELEKKAQDYGNIKIPDTVEKIDTLSKEIIDIRRNPNDHITDAPSKVGYYIGVGILVFLTIYLFVFYSSASYSAFFKVFTGDNFGVAPAIFDAQALNKAWDDGVTEWLLLVTIPFVFLGLGYLIHKFMEKKTVLNYLKIIALFAVTFIFDAILAYEIVNKLNILRLTNDYKEAVALTIGGAFSIVEFWMIIFAGFVVYIIWGLVFDFVMEMHHELDRVNSLVRSKSNLKDIEISKLVDMRNELDKITSEISDNRVEAEKLRNIIDHHEIINPRDLRYGYNHFLNGWMEWLTSDRRTNQDKEEALMVVEKFVREHVEPMEKVVDVNA